MSYVRFTNKSSISSSSQLLLCSPFPRVIDIEVCLKTLKINQRVDSDVNLIVWDASLVLAKYLEVMCERKSDFLSGVKVLELGAGVGLVGLTAAILGAQVTLTDLPETLPLLQSNILENRAAISSMGGYATADILNWGDRLAPIGEFDMVLVADGISNADAINPLLSTLNRISLEYATKPVIYLTQEIRQNQKESLELFLTKLNKHFSVEKIPEEEQHCNFRSPDIMLLKMIHK